MISERALNYVFMKVEVMLYPIWFQFMLALLTVIIFITTKNVSLKTSLLMWWNRKSLPLNIGIHGKCFSFYFILSNSMVQIYIKFAIKMEMGDELLIRSNPLEFVQTSN